VNCTSPREGHPIAPGPAGFPLALAALAVLLATKKVPEPLLIVAAGAIGILAQQSGVG